jgi:prolyl-tRNA editing enzyme YbaK/EbsC (Cys-tRNA(Pro) deacylase)
MTDLPNACQRVAAAAVVLELDIDLKVLVQSSRTAEEAAIACNCNVGQIVKSLVFRGARSGRPVLLLVSGPNRVDEAGVASTLGEPLARPDARYVREVTGYAIGGIPPFGHASLLDTFIDRDLLQHAIVYAAAGTPQSIFAVDPHELARATKAQIMPVY